MQDKSDKHGTDMDQGPGHRTGDVEKNTTAACATCLLDFRFTPKCKQILEKSLAIHQILESDDLDAWHDMSGQYGYGDYAGVRSVQELGTAFDNAEGLHQLPVRLAGGLYGSLHIALAVGAFEPEERSVVADVLKLFNKYHHHLWHYHRNRDGVGIPIENFDKAGEPQYVGRVTLEQACRLQPQLTGLSVQEIANKLAQQRQMEFKDARNHAKTAHRGRQDRKRVMQGAMWNAVDKITENSNEWRAAIVGARALCDVINASSELHAQVFVVDQLLGEQVWEESTSCNGSVWIYEAVTGIEDLIDWAQAPHLLRFIDQYRAKKQEPSVSGTPNNTERRPTGESSASQP